MEDDETGPPPESLLPYDEWTEQALRQVMARALAHAAAHGLPGGHHFYVTFRTDAAGVVVPPRLKAQYPDEMTIVLQHQFSGLAVDEAAGVLSVGLTFGGVPAKLRIPLAAVTAFADPYVRYGLRFRPLAAEPAPVEAEEEPKPETPPAAADAPPAAGPQVVSLDAFRRRTPPRES
jgi:hypothetical protein